MFNGEYGTLNGLLLDLGIVRARDPLARQRVRSRFNLVALVHVWNQAPLTSLLLLAGLQSMPENLHRGGAHRRRGAGAALLQHHAALAAADAAARAASDHHQLDHGVRHLFWTMTHGGPGSATTVFSWMGYAYAFQFFKFGEGAAILYVLTIALPHPRLRSI